MSRFRRTVLSVLSALGVSTCLAGSCASDFRDAAYAGLLDFTTGAVAEITGSLLPVSDMVGAGRVNP